MEKKVKTLIYIAADGSKLVNPAASVLPATTDMVLTSYDNNSLVVDAPIVGEVSTEPQRNTVNELIADWLGKRKMKMTAAKGDFRIREEIREEDGDKIPSLIIEAPDGRPTDAQLHIVVGKALDWIKSTGVKPEPKKDDGKKPEPKKDDGKKPAPAPAPKPEPKKDDGKKAEPAPAPKPEPKKDDGKKAAPEEPKKAAPAPVRATAWDPKKSIEENLDAIMGPAD